MMKKSQHKDSILIDKLGGTAVVSRIFNISMASVSSWRNKGIPASRMMYLEVKFPKIVKDYKNDK